MINSTTNEPHRSGAQESEVLTMSNSQIKKLLDVHNIPNYEMNGCIYADSMIAGTEVFECVEDMTGWSKKLILEWLGY